MRRATIQTVLGDVNRRSSSAKVILFHCSRSGGGQEVYISQAAKNSDGLVTTVGFPQHSPAQMGIAMDVGGRMIKAGYSVRGGEVLKVFVNIRRGYSTMDRVGNFYIRVRPEAAYRVVKMKLLLDNTVTFKEASIEGNFDMLTVEEAMAEGVKCLQQHRQFADPINIERIITSNTIIAPARAPAPRKEVYTVEDAATGETKTLVRNKKRRSIEL